MNRKNEVWRKKGKSALSKKYILLQFNDHVCSNFLIAYDMDKSIDT